MVRLREDPNEGYVYLDREIPITETGHDGVKDV
jgi:hypothetical protein